MNPLTAGAIKRVLCLGAHSDDIEIGCGGTLMQLCARNPQLEVCWVVFTAPGERTAEARRSARDLLGPDTRLEIKIGEFRESFFPSEWPRIKEWFAEIRAGFAPDLIFTHGREDRHQDHNVLAELTWNTFRNHLILEYEIPKYEGDLGHPNVFIPLPETVAARKVSLLMKHFQSQQNKHWFSEDLFWGLMRIRGIECASRHAEAFHGSKLTLEIGPA